MLQPELAQRVPGGGMWALGGVMQHNAALSPPAALKVRCIVLVERVLLCPHWFDDYL
jgi:hypothetical protein